MFTSLTDLAIRHPRRTALLALIVVIAAGIYGGPAAGLLKARNPFVDPSSPSAQAARTIERATHAEAAPGVLALVDAPPSSPRVASLARTLRAVPGVVQVTAPPARGASPLVSTNGRESLVAASLNPKPDPDDIVSRIDDAVGHRQGVTLGGADVTASEVNSQAGQDLGIAELLAFPLLAILGWLIFRGVAALLPLAIGGTSVVGSFVILRLLNEVLSLSSFALNLVIGLGLGLAVDYSLLLVWRFREELGTGADVRQALGATLATAGRTVAFSAVTVAAAMLTLTLFPERFLVSMGIGGAATALVAGAAALLVMPALLVLLARRVGRVVPAPAGTGRWYRLAHAVMRRPALVALGTTAALLAVASPTLGVKWSGIDATVLPSGQSARQVSNRLAADFAGRDANQIVIAVHAPATADPQLATYVRRLRAVPGVVSAAPAQNLGSGTWAVTLGGAGDPISGQAQRTVAAVRAVPAPGPAKVGGTAAAFVDQKVAIAAHLPLALGVLAIVTLLILWLMTGSVVLPVKALLMNAITTATATGSLVLIFQHGRLSGVLDYTGQGGIEQTDFLVLAAVGFALSTDYGVLLMTRIAEARKRGFDNREAIAVGLERTGRVVSASAVLMAVAIGAFATSGVIFLKEIGIGAVVGVMVDAYVVRALLVPSLMVMLGERNWWSPRWLRRVHDRIAIRELPAEPAPPRVDAVAGAGALASPAVSAPREPAAIA